MDQLASSMMRLIRLPCSSVNSQILLLEMFAAGNTVVD